MRIPIKNSASWGDDVKDLSTFVANFDAAFYKLYVVDPSEQNIMVLSTRPVTGPATHSAGTGRLPTDRPVDGMTDLMIDGDIFVAENGEVERVIPASGWTPDLPEDTQLRPTSDYTMLSSPILADGNPSKRIGALYAFDATNHRVVAFNKSDGKYLGQYQLAGDDDAWSDLKGLDVLPTAEADAPSTMWWISSNGPEQRAARGGRARDADGLAHAGPDQGARRRPSPSRRRSPGADGAAVVGDPAPRREPDPADPGGHAVADRCCASSPSAWELVVLAQGGDQAPRRLPDRPRRRPGGPDRRPCAAATGSRCPCSAS